MITPEGTLTARLIEELADVCQVHNGQTLCEEVYVLPKVMMVKISLVSVPYIRKPI